jgi:diketogulonate reductase-like aldo/keto reductase
MLFKTVSLAPRIILGTDKIRGFQCTQYIQQGLAAGYRMIDTAQAYQNEEEIGVAISTSGISRQEVAVTTKISAGFRKNPSSFRDAIDCTRGSLTRLGLDYIDTVLIHHPGDADTDTLAADYRRVTWQALEELVLEGTVRNIGVSNFNMSQILEMREYATVKPCINQIEVLNPIPIRCS